MPFKHALLLSKIAVTAVIMAFTASALAQPKAPSKLDTSEKEAQVFRYTHKANASKFYKTHQTQSISTDSMGGKITTEFKLGMTTTMKTRKVLPDGVAVIETSYDTFNIDFIQNGTKLSAEQTKPLGEMFKKIRSTSKLSARGEPQDQQYEDVEPGMRQMTESLKGSMVGLMPIFPEQPVKIGDSWKQKIPLDVVQGPIKIAMLFNVQYTFLGFTKVKSRRVGVFKADVGVTVNDKPGNDAIKLSLKGKGKGNGFCYFDQKAGELIQSELELEQTVNMNIEASGDAQSLKIGTRSMTSMSLSDSASRQ